MANFTVCQSKWKPIAEPRRAKPRPGEAVIVSEARTAIVQLKSEE